MLNSHGEDGLASWFATPQGQYVLRWEQARLDAMVADIFGYNALQLGLPHNEFLRTNRISYRFCSAAHGSADILTEAHALPLASASLDLVVLPHVLEFSPQPHQVLREVERVLVSEGSAIIIGFNPYSLWGVRKLLARKKAGMPWQGHYFSASRIKDWLTLLGFETLSGDFGCYAPPLTTAKWLERWRLLDRMGGRWWPVGGGVYVLHAIKRVQGMRLITPNWRDLRAARKNLSPVARRGRGVVGNAHKTDLH
jgi:SAM-dependent methyltransferase